MKTFARIEAEAVAELLEAAELPPFHPSLVWVECPPETAVGWRYDAGEFAAPVPSAVWRAAAERSWRDSELARMVWLRDRHRDQLEISYPATLTPEQFTGLLTYMQALRDWPQSGVFPDPAERPVAPAFLEQVGGEQ